MPTTYIAFIECQLSNSWLPRLYAPRFDPVSTIHNASDEGSEVYLVDLKNDRRRFSFKRNARIFVRDNIFVYDSDDGEELAIDESKQFPKNQRIDQ